jgi:GT2 family glycosyltransferase
MNLLQHSTIIEDRLPASALLGEHNQPMSDATFYGDIPITLAKDVCIRFRLIPNNDILTGIRLRFGTYCRINHCHISVQINEFTLRINAHELVDNEYIDIPLPTPQTCTQGQPVEIALYSEDATENNVVAVWCAKISLPFINTLTLKPIIFPKLSPPRVSIIIPVFNKALYTYNCLLTLQANDQQISKEVIIINNASTDDTAALLGQLQGSFHLINNKENKGFVQACRQGAAVAKGEFILFLNNDTQVTPGWLSNMLKLMDTDPSVGITGSKLIYPDGRLQEAGGIIFNDASGWNYGRFQDPTHPKFNQSREVDYCSGASLMIRKKLWEQLGGFDMRYAPAYYEDTDLCFAARDAGYKVFYCHNSEVIHHEGITAGTDISSGYKAYQAINQKKFQAKWWNTLSTNHPAPQTSPEMAAFRFMADAITFRIPENQIIATHFLAQGWAANFWSYLNVNRIDEELNLIKSAGFNTVILLVPWVGFQTKLDPITYYEEYFVQFKQLLDKFSQEGLQVILRLGYTHDNGPHSEPEGFLRAIAIGKDSVILTAWCDYLDRLWAIVQSYPNVLGGFITWEDFFLMDLTHIPLEQRQLFAERTGYQHYLEEHYTLQEISTSYKQSFSAYTEVPIPAFKSSAIHLFCEFWDKLLIDTIFKTSKQHFPALSMEVRTDCDPEEESYICHESTFDLTSDSNISMIYYTPAWGAPNDRNLESADSILKRMQFMFEHIHSKTHNAIFIDQFNFIDNTPGFEHNTGIIPEQIPQFLSEVTPLLQQHAVGYGMWTLHDVRANALKNGLFEINYPCWEIENGEIVFETDKNAALLNQGGILSQLLNTCVGVPYVKDKPFQLDFKIKNTEKTFFTILVYYDNHIQYEKTIYSESKEDWQDIHLENIPFYIGYELKIENKGASILLADFYLYQQCQENGIIDSYGNPKFFYNDLVSLNHRLTTTTKSSSKSFYQQTEITPQEFEGIYSDNWMDKKLLGIIAKPLTENKTLSFIIKAYVPKTWHDYKNQLTLTLDNKEYQINQSIKPGFNEIVVESLESDSIAEIIFLQLEADVVYSPNHYDKDSKDNREVSIQLIEFGFIK